jgi:hypothetical protein
MRMMQNNEWRTDFENTPKNGDVFRVQKILTVRWKKYKDNAPKELKKKGGRWQVYNGYGWENTNLDYDAWAIPPKENENDTE